ncbi:hypothetical protein H8K32_15105 [Undibacterium jejuense]|uniref:Core-binding (CB) domain-containing protein n=1 Tax=Undibacterium jejuense TaxID=1344949 RepID=A0A923HKM9_9BURK|nr:hypothetical protein [Undibacterium jejuense]MBC3863432.1 hypothetical protein [Undibacterium jejuense]
MATITHRGPFQHQAQVRRKGYPTQTRTFESKRDAEDWAKMVETEMRQQTFVDRSEADRTSFGELLERYLQEITPDKRGWRAESSRIRQFQRHPLALRMLSSLRSVDFSNYVKERKMAVGPKTICLELSVMSAVFNVAANDWSIPVTNPITNIRKPGLPQERKRRLVGDEEARLLDAAKASRVPTLAFCITLAIESGMRRGEIADLTWKQAGLRRTLSASMSHIKQVLSTIPLLHRDSSKYESGELQNVVREILPDSRVAACFRHRLGDSSVVVSTTNRGTTRLGGLMVCDAGHICPICHARKMTRERQTISHLVHDHYQGGGVLVDAVLTVPHRLDEPLAIVLDRLDSTWKGLRRSPIWKSLASELGIVGCVRRLEVTLGHHG